MSACGNCGRPNFNGNDICSSCEEMYREEEYQREEQQREMEREDPRDVDGEPLP